MLLEFNDHLFARAWTPEADFVALEFSLDKKKRIYLGWKIGQKSDKLLL